jgi:hypothetical protein
MGSRLLESGFTTVPPATATQRITGFDYPSSQAHLRSWVHADRMRINAVNDDLSVGRSLHCSLPVIAQRPDGMVLDAVTPRLADLETLMANAPSGCGTRLMHTVRTPPVLSGDRTPNRLALRQIRQDG